MPDVIRVLMVISNLKIADGVARFAMTYYSHLDHTKIHMDFAIYDSENINDEYAKQIKENHSKIFALPSVKDMHKHILYCREFFQKRHYDIVHDNSLINTIPLMREAAKAKIPVRILHAHASKLGETQVKAVRNSIFLPILKKYVNCNLACSNKAGKTVFNEHRYEIVPDVINCDKYKFDVNVRDQIRAQEQCESKYIIGTVARIAYPKNPIFALEVMTQVLKHNRDIEYWWVGDGNIGLEEKLKKQIKKSGLENNIRFMGSRMDVSDLYQAMDMFFLPSKFEGFGLSCLEAETSGLPCVVSAAFIKELNITGNVQYISLNSSPEKWARTIECIRTRGEIDHPKRIESYRLVKQSIYSMENASRTLANYYHQMLTLNGEN
jgi:glycosyltransferase involved in cell wall biosynthesis